MAHTGSGNATWVDYPSTATQITATALEAIEGQTDLLPNLRLQMFGGTTRTKPPQAGMYLNTNINGLSGDGVMWGTAFTIEVDTDSMATVGTSINAPATITVPVAGRYLIEVNLEANSTSANCVARIVLNGTNANSIATRTTTQSIYNVNGLATGDGTHLHSAFTYALAASDRIQMFYFFGTTENLLTGTFGATRGTSFSVRYVGQTS
jgi:hypothetical protein